MRLNYDPDTDSLYIHLVERASVESDEVSPNVVLDYDSAGVLVGIDIQNASSHAEIDRLVAEHLPLKALNAA
ncbi:DUF2283 domain-containing protein [Spiribacter vilamensis]|uniref:Uncharacterized protein YuzE n=1 Tax=Spiribacter vilamensis TaxID=531306 RepID=A0A4Q8CZW9_9GAMM|nr:DUF2283 domain-containing protein [Spiribacter vilamensis]RZU98591.1 uncharacterized protein YuzE [Spiribacter vilamensis]TVO60151.1 DUF2283 domain-containing protein [Spiribacter vilamensis]